MLIFVIVSYKIFIEQLNNVVERDECWLVL